MNTKQEGVINFLIYREKGDHLYTAVCLNFDIVENSDDLKALKESIEEAARLHLESVIGNNLDDALLNRSAPQKYWKKLYEGMVAYEHMLNKKEEKVAKQEKPSISDIWNRSSRELVAV